MTILVLHLLRSVNHPSHQPNSDWRLQVTYADAQASVAAAGAAGGGCIGGADALLRSAEALRGAATSSAAAGPAGPGPGSDATSALLFRAATTASPAFQLLANSLQLHVERVSKWRDSRVLMLAAMNEVRGANLLVTLFLLLLWNKD